VSIAWLARPEFKADPYPFYAQMRSTAPVFPISGPLGLRAWLITRYDDVIEFLKDERFSKDVTEKLNWVPPALKPMTHHMLNRNPPDHTRLRALVSKGFTPRRIEDLRGRIESICDELLSAVRGQRSFDLVRSYALALPLTVIAELLGIPESDRRRFHVLAQGSLRLGAPSGISDVVMSMPFAWMLMRYFERLFAERRARPGDDLLSALIQAEESGDRLSREELLAMAFLLLLAGYETTVNLIGSGTLALLEHPEQRARFVEDPRVTASAIEELLRFTSPVEITPPRLTREDVTVGSVTIPRGELVSGVLGSANRDAAQFSQPDVLDLGRDPNRHLALGHGAHYCLGASLARLEGQIALTALFRRFPSLHCARPESVRWRRMAPLRALKVLPVTV